MRLLWRCFLLGIALVTLIFSWKVGRDVFQYISLDSAVKASDVQWQVRENSEESFGLEGFYQFSWQGKVYSGESLFTGPYFPNKQAANEAIAKLSKESWTVFFSQKNPQKSSLQRFFPFLALIRAVLSIAVLVYFVCLERWIKKREV